MKILKLKTENIKKIKAIEITPDGNAIVLSGKNGQGKSSILDSIEMALTGKKVRKPIRDGQSKATIKIDTEKLQITRTFTERDSYLKVVSGDSKLQSPQSVLNKIVGSISFDPLEFARQKDPDQRQTLINMNPELDTKDLEIKKSNITLDRKLANQNIKQLTGELQGIPAVPKETPNETIDSAIYLKKIQQLNNQQIEFDSMVSRIERLQAQFDNNLETIKELQKENHKLSAEISGIQPHKPNMEEKSKLEKELSELEKTNQNVRTKQHYAEVSKKLAAKNEESKKLTAKLHEIEKQKIDRIAKANLPVKGLGLEDDYITFKGIPFSDLADSEKLKISFAIAMAQNPELKVVFIRDGSLLDNDSLKTVTTLAFNHDYQLWIECTDDSGEKGFVIQDGQVIKEN